MEGGEEKHTIVNVEMMEVETESITAEEERPQQQDVHPNKTPLNRLDSLEQEANRVSGMSNATKVI